jgi:RNase P/RNase MRP subunit p29
MRRNLLTAAVVALALAVLLVGVAWAAEAAQSRRPLLDHVARGTVTSVDGESVVLETEAGDREVLISDRTVLWVPGKPPTDTVELAVGDPVLAFGQSTPDEDGTNALSARLVLVAGDEELPRVLIRGRAVSVTRQTIVVQSGNRERAITALPRTRLWSTSGRLGSLRDVHPGDQLIALGQPTELGQWFAGLIIVTGPKASAGRGLRGTVMALDAGARTLTVRTETDRQISVIADDDTRIRIPGVEEAELADITAGDRVVLLGRFDQQDAGRFLARGIGVMAAPDERGD